MMKTASAFSACGRGQDYPDEADLLLDSLGSSAEDAPAPTAAMPSRDWPRDGACGTIPKFMYVKVYGGKDTVDVKVPLGLLRAGLKLTSLIPPRR